MKRLLVSSACPVPHIFIRPCAIRRPSAAERAQVANSSAPAKPNGLGIGRLLRRPMRFCNELERAATSSAQRGRAGSSANSSAPAKPNGGFEAEAGLSRAVSSKRSGKAKRAQKRSISRAPTSPGRLERPIFPPQRKRSGAKSETAASAVSSCSQAGARPWKAQGRVDLQQKFEK